VSTKKDESRPEPPPRIEAVAEPLASRLAPYEQVGGIHAKICRIVGMLGEQRKTGTNPEFGYSFLESDQLVSLLRPLLAREWVLITPDWGDVRITPTGGETRGGRAFQLWDVSVTYTVTDATPGIPIHEREAFLINARGFAEDFTDTGYAKACTAAEKTMLRQLFKISSAGDDPEHTDRGDLGERPHRSAPPASGARPDVRPLSDAQHKLVYARAKDSGVLRDDGDAGFLNALVAWSTKGEIKTQGDLRRGDVDPLLDLLKRAKAEPDTIRPAAMRYFARHPSHAPTREVAEAAARMAEREKAEGIDPESDELDEASQLAAEAEARQRELDDAAAAAAFDDVPF